MSVPQSTRTLIFAVLGALSVTATAQSPHNDEWVKRAGTRLTLAGENYRYSGPNIEWLGIEVYGPDDALGP